MVRVRFAALAILACTVNVPQAEALYDGLSAAAESEAADAHEMFTVVHSKHRRGKKHSSHLRHRHRHSKHHKSHKSTSVAPAHRIPAKATTAVKRAHAMKPATPSVSRPAMTSAAEALSAAEAFVSLLRDEPASEKEELSVKDRIWAMGQRMCKGRTDGPCKAFVKKADEVLPKEPAAAPVAAPAAPPAEATSKPAAPAAAPAAATTVAPKAAPAAAAAKVSEKAKAAPAPVPPQTTVAPAPADDEDDATDATEDEVSSTVPPAPQPKNGKPPKLAAQGFEGKKVRHLDGKTMSSDWHDEYDHPAESSTAKYEKTPRQTPNATRQQPLLGSKKAPLDWHEAHGHPTRSRAGAVAGPGGNARFVPVVLAALMSSLFA